MSAEGGKGTSDRAEQANTAGAGLARCRTDSARLRLLRCSQCAGQGRADRNRCPAAAVTFFRYLFGFLTLLPWILVARGRVFRTRVPHIHALRVLFGMSGVVCMFTALAHLPLADVTSIVWANPLVRCCWRRCFLAIAFPAGAGSVRGSDFSAS